MGAYINPTDISKEDFLKQEGIEITKPSWGLQADDESIVVLMDNGFFTYAGIAYSESEFRAFTDPTDPRPKKFYLVKTSALMNVSNLEGYLK